MDPHKQRAQVLIEQGRCDLAEEQIRQALLADPNDAHAHGMLAYCLSETDRLPQALSEARQAVHLAPDDSYTHFIHAHVLDQMDKLKEAESVVRQAIALDPTVATYHGKLAGVLLQQRKWSDALQAAETGLEHDAEHVGCNNLRAQALVKLGRREEAGLTMDAALARDPDNAFTHANQGWTLLERGDHKKAMEHFREALRLDPTMEWARAGIVEALKAHNIVYRLMLRYFFWMSRLSSQAQWGVMIGAWMGMRVMRGVANAQPELAPFLWPFMGLYLVFVFLSWTADSMFNLFLRLNRFGRLALSHDQILASNFVGGCLLGGIVGIGVGIWRDIDALLLLGIVLAVLVIPVAGTFRSDPGRRRMILGGYTVLLAVSGLCGVMVPGMEALLFAFFIGVVLFSWVGNLIVRA